MDKVWENESPTEHNTRFKRNSNQNSVLIMNKVYDNEKYNYSQYTSASMKDNVSYFVSHYLLVASLFLSYNVAIEIHEVG